MKKAKEMPVSAHTQKRLDVGQVFCSHAFNEGGSRTKGPGDQRTSQNKENGQIDMPSDMHHIDQHQRWRGKASRGDR